MAYNSRQVEVYVDALRAAYGPKIKESTRKQRDEKFIVLVKAVKKELYRDENYPGLYEAVSEEIMLEHAFKRVEAEIAGTTLPKLFDEEDTSRRVTISHLSAVATPEPYLNDDGLPDTRLNEPIDTPGSQKSVKVLVDRLSIVIKVLMEHYPGNASPLLKAGLINYDSALETNPLPIGKLSDAMALVQPCLVEANQEKMFNAGMNANFDRLLLVHSTLLEMFPLDVLRDELYGKLDFEYQ